MPRRWTQIALTAAMAVSSLAGGCGVAVPPLPNLNQDLTLDLLEEIQDDPTLNNDQRRQRIRDLMGLANDDAGNRVANFLLGFNVP